MVLRALGPGRVPAAVVLAAMCLPVFSHAAGEEPPGDSTAAFRLPCHYPLIHEDSVDFEWVIDRSAFDLSPKAAKRSFPIQFDLRDVDGENCVTPVKLQQGGTCWTHGTMASLESHILLSGRPWIAYHPAQEYPDLDEYHLDWWNGFNQHYNADIAPTTGEGLEVHYGGDYLVAAAYLARNDGAIDRNLTIPLYSIPSPYVDPNYDYYYPREIEWLTAGPNLETIDVIKEALQTKGAVATAICWDWDFVSPEGAYQGRLTFYQPPLSPYLPSHSVAIVGWDDTLTTQAPLPGAWLCKNSWGDYFGEGGYFWISYHDKYTGQHPEMGAVTFSDFEMAGRRTVYCHDYHGWRDTKEDCLIAISSFRTYDGRMLSDASFITTADDVSYAVGVYDDFDGVAVSNLLASVQGTAPHIGLHTVALDCHVKLRKGDDFHVQLELSHGGMAYDRTSLIPVLLGENDDGETLVRSTAAPEQSYYWEEGGWNDLYDYDTTGNFCIKAIADKPSPIVASDTIGRSPLPVAFSIEGEEKEVLACHWEFDDGTVSSELTPIHEFDEIGFHSVALVMTTSEGETEYFHKDILAVQADTMAVTSASSDDAGRVKVHVYVRNFLPLEEIVIPFSWDGPLDVRYDSFSVAGCRIEGMGLASYVSLVHSWSAATIRWEAAPSRGLDPGLGPVFSLYFTITGASPGDTNPIRILSYLHYQPSLACCGLTDYLPALVDGEVKAGCCAGRVGDANGEGGDEPTISDISTLIDAKFITGSCDGIIDCLTEADINQSGGLSATCDDITISDISTLIDYLFITGPETATLPDCL